jgi:hypothetical protein
MTNAEKQARKTAAILARKEAMIAIIDNMITNMHRGSITKMQAFAAIEELYEDFNFDYNRE